MVSFITFPFGAQHGWIQVRIITNHGMSRMYAEICDFQSYNVIPSSF